MQKKLIDTFNETCERVDVRLPLIPVEEHQREEAIYKKNLKIAQKNTWVRRQLTISGTRIKFYRGKGYAVKYCTTRRNIPDEILLNNFSEITIDAGSKSYITLCFVEKTGYVYLLDNQVQRTISYTCKGDTPIVHTGDHYPNPSLKYTRANTIFFPKGVTTDYVENSQPKKFLASFHWVPIYIEL